jgi:hypothetical protein
MISRAAAKLSRSSDLFISSPYGVLIMVRSRSFFKPGEITSLFGLILLWMASSLSNRQRGIPHSGHSHVQWASLIQSSFLSQQLSQISQQIKLRAIAIPFPSWVSRAFLEQSHGECGSAPGIDSELYGRFIFIQEPINRFCFRIIIAAAGSLPKNLPILGNHIHPFLPGSHLGLIHEHSFGPFLQIGFLFQFIPASSEQGRAEDSTIHDIPLPNNPRN